MAPYLKSRHIFKKGDELQIKEIEGNLKNSWKFEWLQHAYTVRVRGQGDVRSTLSECITKDQTKGKAFCEFCKTYLNYSGRGKSTLIDHVKTPKHVSVCKLRLTNHAIAIGSYSAAKPKLIRKRSNMSRQIYFAGSIRGGRQDVDLYFKIIEELKGYGKVLTEFVGDKNVMEKEGTLTGRTTDKEIHDDDVRMLGECDCLVAEVTQPSLGVGYEIGRAVAMKKKVLCLYRPQEEKLLSCMIRGAENGDTFIVKDYKDFPEAVDILKNYFH